VPFHPKPLCKSSPYAKILGLTLSLSSKIAPVSSWPRLHKNTYNKGEVDYSVGEIYA
jgi:hypothetical protein